MLRTFCLMNHALTQKQVLELQERFGTRTVVYPPKELSERWGQILPAPEADREAIACAVAWLSPAQKGDAFIVQGEAGATFTLVDYALKNGLVVLHAVTRRVSHEVRAGEQVQKQNVFEHVCFREYEYFSKELSIIVG